MSCSVVDPETMTNAVRAILYRRGGRNLITRFGPFWTEDVYAGRVIGRALYSLNVAAYRERYPDQPADDRAVPTFDFADWRPLSDTDLIVCYKALQCVRYQCNEGKHGDDPLSVAMAETLGLLASEIVGNLEAYKKAPW